MKFFIQIKDGLPFEHPISQSNMEWLFPNFDPENPPEGFEEFIRIFPPVLSEDQIIDHIEYQKVDGKYQDVYVIREKTVEEKNPSLAVKIDPTFIPKNWIFDETKNSWVPPYDPPNDGKKYAWNNDKGIWVDAEKEEKRAAVLNIMHNIDFESEQDNKE